MRYCGIQCVLREDNLYEMLVGKRKNQSNGGDFRQSYGSSKNKETRRSHTNHMIYSDVSYNRGVLSWPILVMEIVIGSTVIVEHT